jgi:hypothetical protein
MIVARVFIRTSMADCTAASDSTSSDDVFVEHQDAWALRMARAICDALVLTHRQQPAALANDGVVALGQAHDHLVRTAVRADIRHDASQLRASA